PSDPHETADDPDVEPGSATDAAFDRAEEPPGAEAASVPKEQRREGRRQRQRVEGGDGDRKCDRERELLIQPARRPREERDRYKDRDQDERGRDDGAEYFSHGVRGRLVGALLVLLDMPLDVL